MRALLMATGTLFVGIGVLGIFLPLLPTTVFLLIAAACYARSSDRAYEWLMTNRMFGRYLRNYHEERGATLRSKVGDDRAAVGGDPRCDLLDRCVVVAGGGAGGDCPRGNDPPRAVADGAVGRVRGAAGSPTLLDTDEGEVGRQAEVDATDRLESRLRAVGVLRQDLDITDRP